MDMFDLRVSRELFRRGQSRRQSREDSPVAGAVSLHCFAPEVDAALRNPAFVVGSDDDSPVIRAGPLLGRRHRVSVLFGLILRELGIDGLLQR
ncbi:hypothetical protein [Mycobacterium avium]|uniref:hypothetical protein n=1 Tax=Mycobacterium avium TaxID=1764 RepID=UPI0002A6DF7C|nr:hypothetical protein [Mycobacterium avium]ELP45591.1 hypothetical protein D522_15920 [Mycobacterium avium subsp. paratuberculosis S5]ETB05002.1 hypothetical protein O979_05545 [Mycobacterium avium subsp. paratuberculosis 10-4404]ETB06611.1 hypothetical protein O978_05765 [Mycobacterium avium subsp. paratuberculosis 10-5864]ETB34289.1 hypothetical protein O977_06160 [Mycobacterium avium subsp. paratuberculosis 10-5975]ETB42278.1 hypothetical protein O975_06270 [Mycobacterium avium subsp. par